MSVSMLDDVAAASGFSVSASTSPPVVSAGGAVGPSLREASLSAKPSRLTGRGVAELLRNCKVGLSTQRHHHHRGFGGSCPTAELEVLLSMVVLKLTSQRLDDTVFSTLQKISLGGLEHRDNSPEYVFMNTARVLSCGDVPICRPITREIVERTGIEQLRELYEHAFMCNPTEFCLVLVGDLGEKRAVLQLLQQYLGALTPMPSASSRPWVQRSRLQQQREQQKLSHPFTPLGESFPSEPVVDSVQRRVQENKASTLFVFKAEMPSFFSMQEDPPAAATAEKPIDSHDVEETILLDIACRALQSRLLDVLRVQRGKVYNVVVDHSRNSLSHLNLISVALHCDPLDCEEINRIILA
jgi:predicted Zn-dependent peptidase